MSALGYGAMAAFTVGFGGFVAVLGILAIVVGWGMWTGREWARLLAIVLYALSALFSLISILAGAFTNIVSLLIAAYLLWYMFRPHVKAFFGRGQPAAVAAPPQPQPAPA